MGSVREMEVLHVDEVTQKPIAVSYDPESLKTEAVRTILNNQITSPNPLEIRCYVRGSYDVGGVFKTINAEEFIRARTLDPKDQDKFVEETVEVLKGPNTFDIIFSEPLKKRTRPPVLLDPSHLSKEELTEIAMSQISNGRLIALLVEADSNITERFFDCSAAASLSPDRRREMAVAYARLMKQSKLIIITDQ